MIPRDFGCDWFVTSERTGGKVGPVTVPYDAMLFEQRDPNTPNNHNTGFYPGGVYTYSKTFAAPLDWAGKCILLEFEGVYMRSEVRLNGHVVGGRPSGYALFHVSLDEHLNLGGDNLVEVVANNDQQPNSRWYSGSGIYRPVHLLVGNRVRIVPHGMRLTTSSISREAPPRCT